MAKIDVVDGWLCDKNNSLQNNSLHYFKVYVLDKKLCLEIADKVVQFSGPGDLLQHLKACSYMLFDEMDKLKGLCNEGFRLLCAIQHSLADEIQQLGADNDYQVSWVEDTDKMLRMAIETSVAEEFQEIIYELLSDSKWFITENGKLILQGAME